MTYGESAAKPPTSNEKRDVAREKAQRKRLEQKKKDKRNRLLVQGGIVVGALVIVGSVVFALVAGIPKTNPGPLNMLSDGIRIGADFQAEATAALQPEEEPVHSVPSQDREIVDIRIYLDYFCPACTSFEEANGEQLATWVESGAATLEIHPVAINDRASLGSKYSTRAANAAACVANYSPNSFFAFNSLLFANHSDAAPEGLDNEQLVALAEKAEVDGLTLIEKCVDEIRFQKWVNAATARAFEGPLPNSDIKKVQGTPTVIVNGLQYTGAVNDSAEFAKFVSTASGNAFSDELKATQVPSASPSPAPAS
jgi:protein-disulfide isomerase